MLAAIVLALILCPIVVRVSGTAFAMLHLAFAQVMYVLALKLRGITGGEDGIGNFPIPPLTIPGVASLPMKDSPQNFYYFAIAVLALSLWLMWFFTKTPFGQIQLGDSRKCQAGRLSGLQGAATKAVIYLVSAAFAGVAGSLYGLFHNLVSADGALGALVSFAPIINIMIGGIGSFMGPILGTAIFQIIEELASRFTDRVELVMGLIFVFVIMYRADGSAGRREDAEAKMVCRLGLHATRCRRPHEHPRDQRTVPRLQRAAGAVRTSICRSRKASGTPSSGRTARARRPSSTSSPAPTRRAADRCSSRAGTSPGFAPHQLSRIGMGRSFQITSTFTQADRVPEHPPGHPVEAGHPLQPVPPGRQDARRSPAKPRRSWSGSISRPSGIVPASALSYGKHRALEISLALATDPELVLLDEFAAGMSRDETHNAVELVRRLTEGKTVVIIEHDMDVVFSLADRITVLHHGEILATGTPAEIRQNQAVKDAYLGRLEVERDMLLQIRDLNTYYGASHVLQGISLDVAQGELVALLGRNGMGKSTTLKTVMGLVKSRVRIGDLRRARDHRSRPLQGGAGGHRLCARGAAHLPGAVGAGQPAPGHQGRQDPESRRSQGLDHRADLPSLSPLERTQRSKGRFLSGGEQQMLAIGRSLMGNPRLLLVDEPTEGLAPLMVKEVRNVLYEINQAGRLHSAGGAQPQGCAVARAPRLPDGQGAYRLQRHGGRAEGRSNGAREISRSLSARRESKLSRHSLKRRSESSALTRGSTSGGRFIALADRNGVGDSFQPRRQNGSQGVDRLSSPPWSAAVGRPPPPIAFGCRPLIDD